jgi:hypothetical protein
MSAGAGARVGRRALVQAALALACAPLLAARGSGALGPLGAGARDVVPEALLAEGRRLGARCRAAGVPADEAGLLAGFGGSDPAALAAFLAAKVRADFAADRLVAIGPWWLAETECRVLALL